MPLRVLQEPRNFVLAICLLTITCCVGGCDLPQSVNPFYRNEDVVFDAGLLGEWQSAESSEKGGLLIKARTADSYTIESTFYDDERQDEATWTFEAHRFIYQQNAYLDFFPIAFRVAGKKENFQTDANGMLFLVPV